MQACILGIQDAFTAQIKAIKHAVCMCMRAWVEDLECACVLHLWYICWCVHFFFLPLCWCLCLWMCVSGRVYNMMGVWSLSPEPEMVYSVYNMHTQTHTRTHWGFLCREALHCLALCISHSGSGTLAQVSVRGNLPSPQKDDCFLSPSLSLITLPPPLIFSLAPSHPLHSRPLSQIGWG